jgi:opacity protein-like surface antigen
MGIIHEKQIQQGNFMKKINKLFLPLLLLTSAIYADNSVMNTDNKVYSFIGMQTSATTFENDTTPTIGLKYGKQSENMRTSLSYSYGADGSNYYQTLFMQMDTGILTHTFKDIPLKPYMGATIGLLQQNDDTVIPTRDRGYAYGVDVGFTYILNDKIDLDLGYRFLETSKLENIDKINDLTFSMHYFY